MNSFPDFPKQEGVALVFGGSGGIGRAICEKFAEAGSDVAFTYRSNAEAAQAVSAAIEAHGRVAMALPVAVEDAAAVREACSAVVDAFKTVHTVVNAAGSHISMSFIGNMDPEEFRAVMAADTGGFFSAVQALLPHMREKGGSFVTISTAGLSRWPTKDGLSVIPKAANDAIIQGIAREEGRYGIRANSVALGLIDAGLFRKMVGEFYDDRYINAAIRNSALKRLGTAEEVAEAVLFFASHRARYVTGQSLVLDGGYSL